MPNESAFNRRVIEYNLNYKESHLKILCDVDLKGKSMEKLLEVYREIEGYIKKDPFFQVSYTPIKVGENAPRVVLEMADASSKTGVGPMAAVAGAMAESIGRFLLDNGAREVVVENGGDIFLKIEKEKLVGIHAGSSQWSNRLALKVKPDETPAGICTSSATVGPSINLGEADAITVVAKSTPLADAAATAIGNQVKGERGIEKALEFGRKIKGIRGFIVIKGGKLAAWGKIPKLVKRKFKVER